MEQPLRRLKSELIIRALGEAARRWTLPQFAPRAEITPAIAERLGYTTPVVSHALDRLFASITREALEAVIINELGSLRILDGFAPRNGRPPAYARGAENVLIISGDTTIGVAIPSMLFALCAEANVLVKDRSDHLIAAFARTLIEEESALAHTLRVRTWENHEASHDAIARADLVVAFGRDETMRDIRSHCKAGARFLPFGHRTSIGYIAREALASASAAHDLARAAALDALLYDGEGCLSPHALFVERGGLVAPEAFAATFARACDDVSTTFPALVNEPTPPVASYRNRMRFRADALGLGGVHPGTNGPHLIVFDPPREEPPPLLPRTVGVYPIDSPETMLAYVREHRLPLEAIGAAPNPREELLDAFIATGAPRITSLGRMQDPPLTGNHGGYERITPFVRFIYRDDEHV